ncbi:MAG: biotin--[acetyl-CoA-carboxylase] ligase [Finegoldia sp.]|nr:biotin--[acetyl-CoA-carboxylase] ligase [Finegoldia sp.]
MKTGFLVLKKLKEQGGDPISGQEIADELGLSRNAIWKAINSLNERGFSIESIPRKGYILRDITKRIDDDCLSLEVYKYFDEVKLDVYKKSQSTNSLCKENMDKGSKASLVVSLMQENGRGRVGRTFYSPRGGLYFSFAYRPEGRVMDNGLLTIAAGLSVYKAFLENYGIELDIKWVNDLIYRDKKVGGILTEASLNLETGLVDYIICGIGLNIKNPDGGFPDDLKEIAGFIFEKMPDNFNPNVLIGQIIRNYFVYLDDPNLIEKYKKVCYNLGKEVYFTRNNIEYHGLAKDINEKGELIVSLYGGKDINLSFGEVKIRGKRSEDREIS